MAHGGKRKGAGNKEGSSRPHISAYWSQEDITEYFMWLKTAYKEKPELAKWVGDQISGKAVQPIANDGDKAFRIETNAIKFI